MSLIGLSGYAKSGKDTFGAFCVERGFARVAFADVMKAMALAMDPYIEVPFADPWGETARAYERFSFLVNTRGWEKAKEIDDFRAFLQKIGTEAGRKVIGEDFWIDTTFQLAAARGLTDIVVTDVRFRNEANAIRARGGIVARVVRPGVTAPNDHVSEHDLDGYAFDYFIDNDGAIEDLASYADTLCGRP